MANFTPLSAAIGGALIGLSAVLLMLLTGRIAGISGIFGGLLNPGSGDKGWRIAFIAGLILAPLLAGWIGHGMPTRNCRPAGPSSSRPACWSASARRLGGGCTSGHGICGVARLSVRSIAATAIFMLTAIATVAITRHVLGG